MVSEVDTNITWWEEDIQIEVLEDMMNDFLIGYFPNNIRERWSQLDPKDFLVFPSRLSKTGTTKKPDPSRIREGIPKYILRVNFLTKYIGLPLRFHSSESLWYCTMINKLEKQSKK